MLIEGWERLRGYDNWTPTLATVKSSTVSRDGEFIWRSTCEIEWRDQNQIEHTAVFNAFEESSLYQLTEGDTIEIQINPAKPSQFYLRGLIESDLTRKWKLTMYALMIIVGTIGFIVLLLAH
jgi:hypothetical protein